MSITPISRVTPPAAGSPVLNDLLTRTLADQTLTSRQRQDYTSATRTMARVLDKALGKVPGQSLAGFPAHPGFLRDRIAHLSAAMAGLSPARWANTKSLVRAALKHAGFAHGAGRRGAPLAPAWKALFARLDPAKHKKIQIGLSRVGRFCALQDISPDQLNDAVMTAFLEENTRTGGSRRPRDVHRTACQVWNLAAATIEGWPAGRVAVPSYRRTYAVPPESLALTLTAEIEAWLKSLGEDALENTDRRPQRPATIDTRRHEIYAYVSALVRHGHPAERLRTLADVVNPDKVKDGLRFIIAHARAGVEKPLPETGHVHAHHIAQMLVSVARHWVKADAATLTRLRGSCRALKSKQHGLRDRNRARLRQFDDQDAIERLVTMPERLMVAVRRVRRPSRKEALKAQLAVVIEVLLMTLMRLENLASLSVGSTLLRSPKGVWRVAFLGHETKTSEPLDAILPAESGKLLDEYIRTYRPLLTRDTSGWLFPGRKAGTPKSHNTHRDQIVDGVWKFCGLVVNPHLFRHIGAKLYLEAHPGAYGVIQLAFGHKSINTTIDNYCGTEGAHALAHFDAYILGVRARANKPAASRRRRNH